jgi:DNA-binding MarR family transcriptional regulator
MTLDTPSECPFYLISRVTLQVTSALKKSLTEVGLDHVKPAYLGVLLCLWQQDNRIVIDLARCARLEPSTMTGLLDRMERDNLLRRMPDPVDRRANRICLTDDGRAVETAARAVTEKVLDKVFDGIAPDRLDQTLQVLHQALNNLEEAS